MAEGDRFRAGQIAITGSAQQLTPIPSNVDTVRLKNMSGVNKIFVAGDNTVSPTTGFPINANETVEIDVLSPRKLWVIGTAADVLAWGVVSS